ncbi:MAG: hypothetical protein JJV99_05425 [Colwellia sp.]|nr:hypothetical protein [Colwellia sp.]
MKDNNIEKLVLSVFCPVEQNKLKGLNDLSCCVASSIFSNDLDSEINLDLLNKILIELQEQHINHIFGQMIVVKTGEKIIKFCERKTREAIKNIHRSHAERKLSKLIATIKFELDFNDNEIAQLLSRKINTVLE